MVTISEPDPGLSEEPEDKSLDREETRKRRFGSSMVAHHSHCDHRTADYSHDLPVPQFSDAHRGGGRRPPTSREFHSSTHVLSVGQTARFTCNASGTPEPTVEWLHNGRPLERDGTDNQSDAWVERGFLFVRGLIMSDSPSDACDLTLDPNTAFKLLSLSEDNRKVTMVVEDQSYPDHPDRFDSIIQVLGREALTGRCYWEVEWEGWVSIGVTYRGITRRGGGGDSRLGENNKSWSLYCSDGGYIAWYNGIQTALPLPPAGSTRVGVYLDRPAGSLSFYRVSPGGGGSSDTLTHLHTFWSSFTQEDLLPGVRLWGGTASLCRL
ncbi:unnamed protein product [Boreogadus saida]